MRRVPLVAAIAVCLMAGAATTALVGLTCSLRSWTTQSKGGWDHNVPPDLVSVIPKSWIVRRFRDAQGEMGVLVEEYTGLGLRISNITVDEMVPGIDKFGFDHVLYVRRAGWPFYALECRATDDLRKPEVVESGIVKPARLRETPTVKTPAGTSVLPVGVLVLGYTADSVIYGGLFLALAFAARRGVRALRVMGRRCRECGYPRRGLTDDAVCPECGQSSSLDHPSSLTSVSRPKHSL